MVTTNSIEEIRRLFGEALTKTQALVSELDEVEHNLRREAVALMVEAIRVVMPTLKYVPDVSAELSGKIYRGVWLDDRTCLNRGGTIFEVAGSNNVVTNGIYFEDYFFIGTVDVLLDTVIRRLSNLGKGFSEALSKIDERRAGLAEKVGLLQKAAAVFQKK